MINPGTQQYFRKEILYKIFPLFLLVKSTGAKSFFAGRFRFMQEARSDEGGTSPYSD
jgi:hypothetical protein